MPEEYIESIIIRQDNKPEVETPSFADEQCDVEFEIDAILVLKQINITVANATHNRHDYVFQVKEIRELSPL